MECGYRCMWLFLIFKGIFNCSYQEFLYKCGFFNPMKNGMYLIDMYRLLQSHGFKFRITFPSEEGTYFISFTTSDAAHAVMYIDGMYYDSMDTEPRKIKLHHLKNRISSKFDPNFNYNMVCVEVK